MSRATSQLSLTTCSFTSANSLRIGKHCATEACRESLQLPRPLQLSPRPLQIRAEPCNVPFHLANAIKFILEHRKIKCTSISAGTAAGCCNWPRTYAVNEIVEWVNKAVPISCRNNSLASLNPSTIAKVASLLLMFRRANSALWHVDDDSCNDV